MVGLIIRPSDLTTERTNPVASEWLVIDNGVTVAKVRADKAVEAGRPTASQAEAEAGTDPSKAMTPLTTKQAIDAQVPAKITAAIDGLATVATTGSYNDLIDKPTLSDETSAQSRAWAIANLHPISAPTFIRTAGYAQPGDGGAALYKYVVAEPSHSGKFSIMLEDGVTVAWYEIAETTLRPEMFGQIGVNAAGDTAAWNGMVSASNARDTSSCVADSRLEISGTTTAFTSRKVNLRLLNAEFYQQTTFSKTLSFSGCDDVCVHGSSYGEGLGGASGEYDGASSSYNGVAFMHFLNCDKVFVRDARERLHAGGGFVTIGCRVVHMENCYAEGIGAPWIDPVGQGNQGNGSDFGFMNQPSDNTLGWIYEHTFVNCRTFNHAFGIQAVQTKSLCVRGCDIGPCPGQHGIYTIECDGLNVQANTIRETRQQGFKMQFENYAGLYIGPAWAPSTAYAVGDTVRAFGTLYICHTAHTSGGSFSSTFWDIDSLMFRDGGIISNNIMDGCDIGISAISTTASDGRFIFSDGLKISGNTFRDCLTNAIYLDRCLDCDITDNTINATGAAGIFLRDFRGRVSNNTFRNTAWTAVYAALSGDLYFEDNLILNAGLSGTDEEKKTASLLVFARNMATTIPDMPTLRYVNFRRPEIRWTGTEGTGLYLFFGVDSNCVWRISDTRCNTGTAKKGRVEGGAGAVAEYWRNDFASMNDTTQNDTTFNFTNETSLLTLDPTTATAAQVGNAFATYVKLQAGKRNGNFT